MWTMRSIAANYAERPCHFPFILNNKSKTRILIIACDFKTRYRPSASWSVPLVMTGPGSDFMKSCLYNWRVWPAPDLVDCGRRYVN